MDASLRNTHNSLIYSVKSPFTYCDCTGRFFMHKNSSGDKTANVNFFYDDIVHVQASAYAHKTDFLISTTTKYLC